MTKKYRISAVYRVLVSFEVSKTRLDPELPPKNWNEWQQYSSKLTDSSKNVYGSGISYDYAYQIAHIMQRVVGLAVINDNVDCKEEFENNSWY